MVLGGAERKLADSARKTQLLGGQLAETRHNAAAGGYRDQLDLGAAHPSNSGQLTLQQQMIRLVVKSPLTDDQIATGVFNLLYYQLIIN